MTHVLRGRRINQPATKAANRVDVTIRAERHGKLIAFHEHITQARPLALLQVEAVELAKDAAIGATARIASAEVYPRLITLDTRSETRPGLGHLERQRLEAVALQVVLLDVRGPLPIRLLTTEDQDPGL